MICDKACAEVPRTWMVTTNDLVPSFDGMTRLAEEMKAREDSL